MIPPYNGPAINKQVNIELGNAGDFALYNLKEDLSQKENLATEFPEKLKEMILAFEAIRGENYGKTENLELK